MLPVQITKRHPYFKLKTESRRILSTGRPLRWFTYSSWSPPRTSITTERKLNCLFPCQLTRPELVATAQLANQRCWRHNFDTPLSVIITSRFSFGRAHNRESNQSERGIVDFQGLQRLSILIILEQLILYYLPAVQYTPLQISQWYRLSSRHAVTVKKMITRFIKACKG